MKTEILFFLVIAALLAAGTNGEYHFGDELIIPSEPPATASSSGTTGMFTWDSSYLYICIATDTWERVAIATWAVVAENVIYAGENVIYAGEQVEYP